MRLRATVIRPPPQADTIRFAVPAVARRCGDGRSLLLEGASQEGNGVLVLLRYGDTLAPGPYPLITLGDSLTPRGAAVAVRFVSGAQERGFALDSGAVSLRRGGREPLDARVNGWGLDGVVRIGVEAAYEDLRVAADTVPCHFQQ